jgi:hypothetical protein
VFELRHPVHGCGPQVVTYNTHNTANDRSQNAY